MKRILGNLDRQLFAYTQVRDLRGLRTRDLTGPLSVQEELIKIEVGLRKPLLTPEKQGEARTLLRNPVSGSPLVPVLSLSGQRIVAGAL